MCCFVDSVGFLPEDGPGGATGGPGALLTVEFGDTGLCSPIFVDSVMSDTGRRGIMGPPGDPIGEGALTPTSELRISTVLRRGPVEGRPVALARDVPGKGRYDVRHYARIRAP